MPNKCKWLNQLLFCAVIALSSQGAALAQGWEAETEETDVVPQAQPMAPATATQVSGQQGSPRQYPMNTQNNNGVMAVSGQPLPRVQHSYITGTQSLPSLPPVTSGAVRPGTHYSPGSLALLTQTGSGGELPQTENGSFVARSGFSEFEFGDETTQGPPPLSRSQPIGDGSSLEGLTTGHHDPKLPTLDQL